MLKLKYREVARTNIEKFDQLGAFNGKHDCLYHYEDGSHCAIGVCDPKMTLADFNNASVTRLPKACLKADDIDRLQFIQSLHDYRARCDFDPFYYSAVAPDSVSDLVKKITWWKDLTPDLYKEIMRRLAEE